LNPDRSDTWRRCRTRWCGQRPIGRRQF